MSEKGSKFDNGKPMMHLVDPKWLLGVAGTMTYGARKYSRENWRKGIEYTRIYDAMLRHMSEWLQNIDIDPESGQEHLLHASCCLMMLYGMKAKPELDDRYKE